METQVALRAPVAAAAPAVPAPQKLAAVQAPASNVQAPVSEVQAPVSEPAPAPAPARPSGPIVASLESDAPPVFSPSMALALPLDLRMGEDATVVEASLPASDMATPTNPEPIPAAPEAAAENELFHGKPAPLPPVRPTSLDASSASQLEAALTPAAANLPAPPPVPGQGRAPVLSAPAAAPSAAAPQSGFTGFANALAAVTSSVGGASSVMKPAELEPAPPEVARGGFKMGDPVYIRIFKKESVLELWMKRGDGYALYKTFPVCRWSGQLGPKLRFADYQSPEGFYEVSARQLNPHSHFHLAFDLGYPNAYDRRHGATGNAVMVHGDCKSVGCFAMTNAGIDQIYPIVAAALRDGEREVPVHIFPFRMTDQAIARESAPRTFLSFLAPGNARPHQDWSAFWRNLKQGYDIFERTHIPPVAYACGDRYEFGAAGRSCARIAGW
nr:murein L,D-transpeptidase family protein [Candidatus Rhodoblastus alkanivorans]